MGQHFMLALEGSQDDIALDLRDCNDELDTRQLDSRLHCVQESIRQLDPTLMAPQGDVARQLEDRSLRVHACHTRLRELEVLRDALLRELKEDKHLKPADIVVMAPDIRAYVALIPRCLASPASIRGRCRTTSPTSPLRVAIRCSRRSVDCWICRSRV
jgi:exodeoxyribonuclease V gamma subunit